MLADPPFLTLAPRIVVFVRYVAADVSSFREFLLGPLLVEMVRDCGTPDRMRTHRRWTLSGELVGCGLTIRFVSIMGTPLTDMARPCQGVHVLADGRPADPPLCAGKEWLPATLVQMTRRRGS